MSFIGCKIPDLASRQMLSSDDNPGKEKAGDNDRKNLAHAFYSCFKM
jgi:hypothetical protein